MDPESERSALLAQWRHGHHTASTRAPGDPTQAAAGDTIRVEQEPRARRLYRSHVLELGTQLVLVEANFGQQPPHGVVVLAGGRERRIAFDQELEDEVLGVALQVPAHVRDGVEPGKRWLGARCQACEYHACCWDVRR